MPRRLLRALTLAALLAPVAGAVQAEDAPAPRPAGFSVPTAFQAYAGWSPRPGDPTDRLPAGPALRFVADERPPEALLRPLERPDGAYALVPWAGRTVLIGLYAAVGSSLAVPLLCVDADGDGAFEGVGERRRVRGRKADAGESWSAEFTVQGVPGVLTFERSPTERRALLRAPTGARTLPQRPLTAETLEAPPGAQVVLLALLPDQGPGPRPEGAGEGRIAWARGPGTLAYVGLDADGDGRLSTPGEWRPADPVEPRGGFDVFRAAEVPWGGRTLTLELEERLRRTTGTLAPPGALRGTATLGGRQQALFLLDLDLDGAYTSPGDLWWFGPVERLGRLHELTPDTLLEGDEPAFLGTTAWRLRIVEADGTAHLSPDPAAGTLPAYLGRRAARTAARWAPRLEAEAPALLAANGIAADRPKAARPPAFLHALDLVEPLARAQAEQRPVLAFFEADWCPWCHRLLRHSLGDAEVAALLERFVCVRLNHDFVAPQELARQGVRGLPHLRLLDPAGRLLEPPRRAPGTGCPSAELTAFEAPAVLAGRLRAALAVFDARGRGAGDR